MIEIIENINQIIQQFAPGYIAIRLYYILERPKFNLDHKQIVDSIFLSIALNSIINIIPIIKLEHRLIFSILLGITLSLLFYFKTKPILWIQNKFGIRFTKDFSHDPLKKYSEGHGCYVRIDLYEEHIKVQGMLDYYEDEEENKGSKYIVLSEYEIYDYNGKLIEKYGNDNDVIMIDQRKVKYLKIYR